MRHKGYFKKCMGILVLLAVILSQTGEAEAVSLSSITSDSIREKEGQISEAQDEKKQLQSALTDIKALKDQL